jgi:hypothetical protein
MFYLIIRYMNIFYVQHTENSQKICQKFIPFTRELLTHTMVCVSKINFYNYSK